MSTTQQYETNDLVVTCLACGASSLTKDKDRIIHYKGCGGVKEIEKWDKYYSDPEKWNERYPKPRWL